MIKKMYVGSHKKVLYLGKLYENGSSPRDNFDDFTGLLSLE